MRKPTHPYRVFQDRLHAFTHERPRVDAGNVEAVHRTRVASRRLRELIPLLALDADVARRLNRDLRKVTTQLGAVRELDVLMLLIEELGDSHQYSATALRTLRTTAAQARVSARQRLSAKLPTAKLKRLGRRLERVSKSLHGDDLTVERNRASGSGSRHVWFWALEARLAQRAARVRAAIERAGAVYVPEHLHRVRIAVKKLRYAAELSAGATHKRIATDIAALRAAQDSLGRLHDLEVLLSRAREAQALCPPDLTTWRDLGALVHVVENDCRHLHARYMSDRTHLLTTANRMAAGTRVAQAGGGGGALPSPMPQRGAIR